MIKYSGAGNTFVLMKGEDLLPSKRAEWVPIVCSTTFGIATDGVLFLDQADQGMDFIWDFYNADGSRAEMCGNAARCAALFVFEKLQFQKEVIQFLTLAGPIQVQKMKDLFNVKMPDYKVISANQKIKLADGFEIVGQLINTGVPHFVIDEKDLGTRKKDLKILSEIRHHSDFNLAGANVTILESIQDKEISAVTFERGVENFTLACGTGAVAAAIAGHLQNNYSEYNIRMPGGLLSVQLGRNNQVSMIGPAQKIADVSWFHKGQIGIAKK